MSGNRYDFIGGTNKSEKIAMTKINMAMWIIFIPLSVVMGLISNHFGWIASRSFHPYEQQLLKDPYYDSRGLFYKKENQIYTD